MKNIAVFASGSGTNFQYLVDAEKNLLMSGRIKLLISDKPNALVNERARIANVPTFAFDPKKYTTKADYEQILVEILHEYQIDLIVLAGYMRIVGATLLASFPNKIINLHPSLLPAFAGKDAIAQAINYGVKVTGVTVHFVDEGMDTGAIILQKALYIAEDDTLETLTVKIHSLEHEILLRAVNLLVQDQVVVNQRTVVIKE